MDSRKQSCSRSEDVEIRKGPWTMEEDLILINYITTHGEGVWNSLAKAAGLKRTGKSCRLRWLNYLRPDVRRGNISPEEQILIMDLHAKWGNRYFPQTLRISWVLKDRCQLLFHLRWSKIAKHLPGRTDNEIKNFWRTRIQKQLKQGGGNDQSSSGQSYKQAAQSTSQLSRSSSTALGHDPYSASSYAEPMDTSVQLSVNGTCTGGGVGAGGGSAGGGTTYLMLPPQSHPHPTLPSHQMGPESTENFWGMDPDPFWPMQYYGEQRRLT